MSMQLSVVVVGVVGVAATPVVCHMHHQFSVPSWGWVRVMEKELGAPQTAASLIDESQQAPLTSLPAH